MQHRRSGAECSVVGQVREIGWVFAAAGISKHAGTRTHRNLIPPPFRNLFEAQREICRHQRDTGRQQPQLVITLVEFNDRIIICLIRAKDGHYRAGKVSIRVRNMPSEEDLDLGVWRMFVVLPN